jgi:hypothetical protein
MSSSAGEGTPAEEELPADGQAPAAADNLAAVTAAKALALVKALGETLAEIGRRLEQYSAFGRRSRQIILGLAVSFALDIIITIVLGLTALAAHGTAAANAQLVQELHAQQVALHTDQLASCANGNTFRSDQDTIWRDFITLITKPAAGEPPAQVAKTNKLAMQFLAYVSTVNHPVNCKALYGG